MVENKKLGKLFVISAPSGAGKTTLTKEVINRLQKDFPISKVITYTTRAPRKGEENGKDYFFVSHDEFDQKAKEGFFLETTEYQGHKYGSPSEILTELELGKSFVIITDIEGVKNIKHLHNHALFIWVKTSTIQELKKRLVKRGSLTNDQIEERLAMATGELKEAEKARMFDYNVVNEVFEQTVGELIQLVKKELN